MRSRSVLRKLRLLAILAAFAVLAVLGGGSIPGVCGTCHQMRPFVDALQRSAHAGVRCYRCHADPSSGGLIRMKALEVGRMVPRALAAKPLSGPVTRIGSTPCLSCHGDVLHRVSDRGAVRIDHGTCSGTKTCDACHSTVAHGSTSRWQTTSVMEDCVACHRSSDVSTACDACHTEREPADRLTASPWRITHGAAWRTTHGMGDLRSCDMCHRAEKCVSCHDVPLPHDPGFASKHSSLALQHKDACESCHDRARFCDGCHGIPMPHPAQFLKEHPRIAKGRQDARCTRCHDLAECSRCHVAHTHPGRTDGTLGKQLPRPDDQKP